MTTDDLQSIHSKNKKRDELIEHLNNFNIGNAIYYPLPLHLQNCFDYLAYKEGDFPEAESAAKEVYLFLHTLN